jgi:transcriptional regulator GlxA family with amidase domain
VGRSKDVLMHDSRPMPKASGRGLAPWQADLALRLLLDNSCRDFPVAALATRCGLSRSYFIRAFKVSMGLPPHHWLMQHRVERARNMLARTNEGIGAIALSCGFADQSHLTRVFHTVVGTSPAAWRRRRRADVVQR